MAESLGEVTQQVSADRIDLFREEANVIDKVCGSFEGGAGPSRVSRPSQGLGQPERAQKKRAFLALESVLGPVAVHKSPLIGETLFGRVIVDSTLGSSPGRNPTSDNIRLEASRSSDPKMAEGVGPIAPTFGQYRLTDQVLSMFPRFDTVGCVETVGQGHGPIKGHPTHQLGVQEVAVLATNFPYPLVLFPSASSCRVRQLDEKPSGGRRQLGGAPHCPDRPGLDPSGGGVEQVIREAMHGTEQFAVDIKLALAPGTVSDPDPYRSLEPSR